jgi:hypothetical protein
MPKYLDIIEELKIKKPRRKISRKGRYKKKQRLQNEKRKGQFSPQNLVYRNSFEKPYNSDTH